MIPVEQTRFLSNGERGNCLAACLASIFEKTITEVPAFESLPPGLWRETLNNWTKAQGFDVSKASPECHGKNFYIAVGNSSRGNKHATVGLSGDLIHDPDFHREGLASIEYLFVFKKITQ